MLNDVENLASLIKAARQETKGELLSASLRDMRIALYLIAHGVEIPVRCGECVFAVSDYEGGLRCTHPNRRNPQGCWDTEYCDAGVRRDEDE